MTVSRPTFISVPLALLTLVAVFTVQNATAQFGPQIGLPEEYVDWSARPVPSNIGAGGTSVIKLSATIKGDWKMYALDSIMPSGEDVISRPYGVIITIPAPPAGLRSDGTEGQIPPEQGYDPNFDLDLAYFHERATFYTAVTSTDSVASTFEFEVDVRYQICSDELGVCLRHTTATIPVMLNVDPTCIDCTAAAEDVARAASNGMDEAFLVAANSDFDGYKEGGIWPFLLLAIGAGLASLLTPCVFPMIPLTVSYFTKQGHSRSRATRMALLFGLSIVVTFTVIGVVMAIVVGAAGAQTIASNPWVNLMIAAVLIGFALSLLGLYEIRIPSSVLTWVGDRGTEERGWVGILFMGLTLTLVSFSCTAPFVGGLLAATSTGTWLYPLFGMIVYSTTFALPFVLLALFPQALDSLPKSGVWMNSVKVVLGFVELAAAVKFVSNADLVWGFGLFSRTLGIGIVVVIFFVTGLYLLGKIRFNHEPAPARLSGGRVLASGFFFVFALYLIPGLLGAPLGSLDAYLPPRQDIDARIYSMLGREDADILDLEEGWFIDDIEGAFEQASKDGRPVFVDFSGWTCTNCRDMETNVFPDPAIVSRFEMEFVPLRLYTDDLEKGDAFHEFQMSLTGTPALPTYAIVAPNDRSLISRQSALMELEDFKLFLDAGLDSFKNRLN